MNQLGIKNTQPYHNICVMDSREIKSEGLIKDLKVSLIAYPDISIMMDVLLVDVPPVWGMLLPRKWSANFGGSLHKDLSYATILTCEG